MDQEQNKLFANIFQHQLHAVAQKVDNAYSIGYAAEYAACQQEAGSFSADVDATGYVRHAGER
jgi:hypothetical protein